MNINVRKTVAEINTKLQKNDLKTAYSLTTKLRSQLIGIICERGFEVWSTVGQSHVSSGVVTLKIDEPLPPQKELTASMQEYWLELIHAAIAKSSSTQKPPYFNKAFVLIEIITPKYSDNSQLWDTSNRSINLVINNLKGIFFKDDNFEHMAFGVVGGWGEFGQTIIRIMPFEMLDNLIKNQCKND